MKKRNLNISLLVEVMDMIIDEKPLPQKYCNHPLHGEWKGAFDCHIQGDWILIYEPDLKTKTVTFHQTGTHSDLF